MTFIWATAKKSEEAGAVIFGVPDESGSHSLRKGAAKAPDVIREISNQNDVVKRGSEFSLYLPQGKKIKNPVFDAGNLKKREVAQFAEKLARQKKLPVAIGGDHSITFELLKGISKVEEHIRFVYLDAHPDFICSSHGYYGSVICDASQLRQINLAGSVEIGIRAPEAEEIENMRKGKVTTITSEDVFLHGVRQTLHEVRERIGFGPIYLSIDMDVVDPAFAPGVSTPFPGGITARELLFIVRELSKNGLVGLDVMEVCPPYDQNGVTAHLASRAILEALAAIK